jgi:uncharacterized protein
MTISRKALWRWVWGSAIMYILVGAALYFTQELFLFHGKKLPADHVFVFDTPFKEYNITRPDGSNLNLVRFLPADSIPEGVVIYYHGNMRNIERYAPHTQLFTAAGYEVWMMDYAGFGKSTGRRTEAGMYADADTVYRLAAQQISADSIIIYGKSIGTGVAAHIAARRPCRRLMLETPYYSIASMASGWFFMYPTGWLVKYKFPTCDNLPLVKAPITIFHGTRDGVIDYKNACRLKKLLKPNDEFVTIPKATHNNIPDYQLYHDKVDSLLSW